MNHRPSRRQLLKLLALTGATSKTNGIAGQTVDEKLYTLFQQLSDKVTIQVYRPEDLLELNLTYIGYQHTNDKKALRKTSSPQLLIVEFPAQSLAEEAFEEGPESGRAAFRNNQSAGLRGNEKETLDNRNPTLPAKTMLSGKSRLVFSIPATVTNIPLTAKALLDWDAYIPVVSKRVPAARTMPVFTQLDSPESFRNLLIGDNPIVNTQLNLKPLETKPTPQTEIQRQSKLNLAQRGATKTELKQLQKKEAPSSAINTPTMSTAAGLVDDLRNGKTPRPLHAEETCIEMPFRLFISPNTNGAWNHEHKLKTRPTSEGAISSTYELWHTRLTCKTCIGTKDINGILNPLRTVRALWATDISGDYRSKPRRDASMVTSLYNDDRHAIVHESSNWSIAGFTPQPVMVKNLMLSSLGAWLDADLTVQRESLEKAGVLSTLNLLKWKHIATMARDHYVEIVYAGNMFPFGHEASLVRVTQRRPQQGYAINRQRYFIAISEEEKKFDPYDPKNGAFRSFNFSTIRMISTSTPSMDSPRSFCRALTGQPDHQFIPMVDGKEFLFKMTGFDLEGNEIDFEMPLVFLSTDITRTATGSVNRSNINKLVDCFSSNPKLGRNVSFRNQKMALTRSQQPGDTSVEVKSIDFSAAAMANELPGFHPVCTSLEVFIEAVDNMAGEKKPAKVELVDDEQNKPIASRKNKSGVYAKILSNLAVELGGGKSNVRGGIKPDFSLSGLSKSLGAFGGNIEDIKIGKFNPGSFFSETAKLFGSINLKDIISSVDKANVILEGTLLESAFPMLKHTKTPKAYISQYSWNAASLKAHDFGIGKFKPKNNRPGNLIVDAKLHRYKDTSQGMLFELDSRIENFSIELVSLASIHFKKVGFKVDSKTKLDFTVDMDRNPIKFLGVLSFINDLQRYIPGDGFSDPPFLDVTPTGVLSGYTLGLPDIQLGVFTLRKISLSASVKLPFDGTPMIMRFAFCEKSHPFDLTVSSLGGGGFFALEFDMNGLRNIEAALEFGATVSLNVGIASGSVKIKGGVYFKMVLIDGNNKIQLQGYIRINGNMSVEGIISIAVDFMLALNAEIKTVRGEEKVSRVWGEANLRVKVEVFMLSKVFKIKVQREFAGAGADPTFGMLISPNDWEEYCAAFAA